MCKFSEHRISGGLVISHKSPEEAFLLQCSLNLKEHWEIKFPFLQKLKVGGLFVLGREVFFLLSLGVTLFEFGLGGVFGLWGFGASVCLFYVFNSSMLLPLNVLKIFRNKENSRTDDESD